VASLEAELKTTLKALKDADATKASAVKAAKAAEARAIKTEKALAEVSQKQDKREGGVVKRLDKILASVGNKFFLPLYSAALLSVDMLPLAYLHFS
jgi:Flp pilus assembly protein TadB